MLCRLLLVSIFASGLAASATPAYAFKIFGMRFFESEEAEEPVIDPLDYAVTFETGDADDRLAASLRSASTLLADAESPVSGSLGLIAKARSERELLVATLYEAARYDGTVAITIEGRPLDDIPPDAEFSRPGPVPVTVSVMPGQVFTLGDIALAGDAAGIQPARFGLIPGGNAGSRAILRAEIDIVRALKEEGRPMAHISAREIVADHATGTLDVSLTLEAGPIAPFGDVSVEGAKAVDPDFTAYMTGIERGKQYSPQEMEDARERLLGLEVFNSVRLTEAEALAADGTIPIDVTVSERKHRYFGIGATYSNTDGGGFEGYWGHRNLFGRAEKLRIEGSISRIGASEDASKLDYNAALLFEKPGVLGPASKFVADAKTVLEHPDAYDRFTVGGGAGVAYDISKTQSASARLTFDYSKIDDAFGEHEYLLLSVPLQYAFDNRNDRLNATRGFRAVGFLEPSYDFLGGSAFVKARGEGYAYQALDDASRFVAAGRVTVGSIVGASVEEVPADRRFYAGGGGSVRGYGYQDIGPEDSEGKPTGGLSLVETSVEMRIQVTDTIGIVPFIDGAAVSESSAPDFSGYKAGAGLGFRYMTPFGPLRVDAAVPLNPGPNDPSFGIYAGIGQAF